MTKKSNMHSWVVENRPDKLSIFETCQKLGEFKCEHYWGYLPKSVSFEDAYGEEESEYVGVFKANMNGYKWSTELVPYPSEDELLEKVTELHVTGDDLKKDKWTLLADAYIKDHA